MPTSFGLMKDIPESRGSWHHYFFRYIKLCSVMEGIKMSKNLYGCRLNSEGCMNTFPHFGESTKNIEYSAFK